MAAFTTIAAGVALTATLAGTGMSFANAGKQKGLAKKAAAEADAAMAKARGALERNFYEQQAINKEPYELEREALLSSAAQAMDAAKEAGLAPLVGTAGRIQMGMNEAQAGVTGRMGAEASAIEKSIINEKARLRDLNVQLDLGEVAGAQEAERDAREAQALATQQGMQGVTSAIGQAAAFVPLFAKQDMIEPVMAEGLKPMGTTAYQAPLPTASLSQFSGSVKSAQTAGFAPINPYSLQNQALNPFMFTKY
jgi:hypothetical protein